MLNDKLYRALQRRFGDVKVSNEGLSMHYKIRPSAADNSKYLLDAMTKGEYYRVCCPYCGDRRFRLTINHRWRTTDPNVTYHGRPVWFGNSLAICFNEECDLSGLSDTLKPYINRYTPLITAPPRMPDELFKEVEMPGKCVPLKSLALEHQALVYLRQRGFDPVGMADVWNVEWCEQHENRNVRQRLIFPVYREGVRVGWQARRIYKTEDKRDPKYYTMPGLAKGATLYNIDVAKQYRFCVVVEGVMDTAAVGVHGVGLLGNKVTELQARLLRALWGHGAVVLLLDESAREEMEVMQRMLGKKSFRNGIVNVILPYGTDPGDYATNTEDLWRIISETALRKGVDLVNPV